MINLLKKLLETHKQEHLLEHWNELDNFQKEKLYDQIKSIPFQELNILYKFFLDKKTNNTIPDRYSYNINHFPCKPKGINLQNFYTKALEAGECLIKEGRVGVITLAGGVSSRLGNIEKEYSKGFLQISPIKRKTIFKILSETITGISNKFGTNIPWFIMASPNNINSMRNYFDLELAPYGLPNPILFEQQMLPVFNKNFKIIMENAGSLCMNPIGHGDLFSALKQSNIPKYLKKRNIKYLFIHQIDNPLTILLDPLFIGLHHLSMAQITTKIIPFNDKNEKVGIICRKNRKRIIEEYINIDTGKAIERMGTVYSNSAVYMYSFNFINKLNNKSSLPLNLIYKDMCLPENCRKNHKEKVIKFERFIFDSFYFTDRVVFLEADRHDEYSPIKYSKGAKSQEACIRAMNRRNIRWIPEKNPDIFNRNEISKVEYSFLKYPYKEDLKNISINKDFNIILK